VPVDFKLLEPHSGRVGGFDSAQNCDFEKSGGIGDNIVSVSVQTVHNNCKLVWTDKTV
jgi:hypothetical protein